MPIAMPKKTVFTFILLAASLFSFAQDERARLDRITDSLIAEGKALYRSEWASWYGTDVFEVKCPGRLDLAGGYFSYETDKNLVNIFFTKGDDPLVLASITFVKDFNKDNYILDTLRRKFTPTEQQYFDTRKAATARMYADTIVKGYKNTTLNVVPMVQNGLRKAYVLTGTSAHGVVLFGNDYLINFDADGNATMLKALHKNLIPVYMKTDSGQVVLGGMHTHLPSSSEFITATDICTLMLYEGFTSWTKHYVMSKNYVSIWDCKKNELMIMTTEAWKKVGIRDALPVNKE
jgi:hypothetical protein